jgi:hypothetical protein
MALCNRRKFAVFLKTSHFAQRRQSLSVNMFNYNSFSRKSRMRDIYKILLNGKNALLMLVLSFFGQSFSFICNPVALNVSRLFVRILQ